MVSPLCWESSCPRLPPYHQGCQSGPSRARLVPLLLQWQQPQPLAVQLLRLFQSYATTELHFFFLVGLRYHNSVQRGLVCSGSFFNSFVILGLTFPAVLTSLAILLRTPPKTRQEIQRMIQKVIQKMIHSTKTISRPTLETRLIVRLLRALPSQ